MAQKGYKKVHYQMLDEAKMLLASEDHEEAAKLYKRLLPVDPLFTEVQHDLGVCYANIPGKKDRAVEYFERGVEGGFTESFFELAVARHRQQRFEEALSLLDRYVQKSGRMVEDAEVERLFKDRGIEHDLANRFGFENNDLRSKVAKQSAALKLAREALFDMQDSYAAVHGWKDSFVIAATTAIAAIDSLQKGE